MSVVSRSILVDTARFGYFKRNDMSFYPTGTVLNVKFMLGALSIVEVKLLVFVILRGFALSLLHWGIAPQLQ